MQAHKLRLITLNCLFHGQARTRLRAIGRLLRESSPDVACLQEVLFRPNLPLLQAERITFQGWGPAVAGGLVTVSRTAVESWSFERFRTALWFEWAAQKGFLTTRFDLDGEKVSVVNTHLLANYDEDWAIDNRYARLQIAELGQLGDAIRRLPETDLVLVAGDFNVPSHSPQFVEFMAACGLSATLDWRSQPPEGRGHLAIDNVLYRGPRGEHVSATAAPCFEDPVNLDTGRSGFVSDHVGVAAEIRW